MKRLNVGLLLCVIVSQVSCRALDPYHSVPGSSAAQKRVMDAALAVLSRHFTISAYDRPRGVIVATTPVAANIYTKHRARAVATVSRLPGGDYGCQIRVTDEFEVSEPSHLGLGQPGYDWRAVGFDKLLEASLMSELDAELGGRPVPPEPARSSYVMFRVPTRGPLRHRDLFRPPVPDLRPAPPKAPAPKPAAARPVVLPVRAVARREPAAAKLYEQYIALGDTYMRRGEHDKALLEYQRAALARPASSSAHLSLASVWAAIGHYPAGAESLRPAADALGERTLSVADLARQRDAVQDLGKSLLLLKGFCKKHPADNDARLLLGYHCILADRAGEARDVLGQVLKAKPEDSAARCLARQIEARRS